MTAVAEELFVPEANCGTDASTTADEIDIGNIGENENSTIEDVLGSLSTDGCRCLSSTLYLAIHLLRAYFEVKLDILAAILGGSLHPLANLLVRLVIMFNTWTLLTDITIRTISKIFSIRSSLPLGRLFDPIMCVMGRSRLKVLWFCRVVS